MKKTLYTLIFTTLLMSNFVASQTFEWAKKIGGMDNDEISAITSDNAGNIYVIGKFASTADFDPSPALYHQTSQGLFDAYVAKYNDQGALIWAKQFMGLGAVQGTAIIVDNSGNVYAGGAFEGTADFDPANAVAYNLTSNGADDAFVVKLDTDGNFVWANSFGGTSYDAVSKLALDQSGNLVVGGSFVGSNVDFDPSGAVNTLSSNGSADIYILKLNSAGNYITAFNLGSFSSEYISGLAIDASNNMIITGTFSQTVNFNPSGTSVLLTSNGSDDVFICKYDFQDLLLWVKQIGGIEQELSVGLTISPTGNIYIAGQFYGDCDIDPGASVTNFSPTPGYGNSYVLCLDLSGNYVWARNIGGTHFTEAMCLDIDANENVYLSGKFRGTVTLDANYGTIGQRDVFVYKLNETGSNEYAFTLGSAMDDYAGSIHVDNSGNLYTAGYFQQTIDFDPGVGVTNLTANGLSDIFIQKMSAPSSASIFTHDEVSLFNLYPNPGNDYVTVHFAGSEANLVVFSANGQKVLEKTISDMETCAISSLESGVYLVELTVNGSTQIKRFIKN